ncbi:MAG: hypothetical protein ACE5GE_15220, partial [Phycisphaerae bacterium]
MIVRTAGPYLRKAHWVWPLVGLCCLTGLTRADVDIEFDLPDDARGHPVHWAIRQNGRAVAQGVLTAPDGNPQRRSASCPDGAYELIITINYDELLSYFPSMGDRYQLVPFTVAGKTGRVSVGRSGWDVRRISDPANLLTVHYYRF